MKPELRFSVVESLKSNIHVLKNWSNHWLQIGLCMIVRLMLEKMGKTLFFRSGNHPLILSEEQREERKACKLRMDRQIDRYLMLLYLLMGNKWMHCLRVFLDLFLVIYYINTIHIHLCKYWDTCIYPLCYYWCPLYDQFFIVLFPLYSEGRAATELVRNSLHVWEEDPCVVPRG